MPTFTPVDFDPFAPTESPRAPQGVRLVPVDHDPFAAPAQRRTVSQPSYDAAGNVTGFTEDVRTFEPSRSAAVAQSDDIFKGAAGGLVRGVAGTLGLVTDTLPGFISSGMDRVESYVRGETPEQGRARVAEKRANVMFPGVRDALSTEGIQRGLEKVTGPAYVPETRAGKIASGAAEFVPGALIGPVASMGRNAAVFGAIPGAVSEIAGQVFEGSPAETPARIVGGLGAGVGGAMAMRRGVAPNMVREALGDVTPAELNAAERLFLQAQEMGQPISRAEAVQAVTMGRTGMGDLQHTVEGMGGMREFYSARPMQNEAAARRTFDTIAPASLEPSQVGPTVGTVARQVVDQSPEGRILADTLWQAGPRVTPEGAGNVIQQDLRNVYDRREGVRSAFADQDYKAARNAPATIPMNGGYREADVTTHYLNRPDIQILLDPVERQAARAQWLVDNNPTSRVPIVGERPTQFAQVDAGPVVDYLDSAIGTAKGAVRQGLQAARSALLRPDGTLDTTVQGLHNSRVAIGDLIDQATRAGANSTASQLKEARNVLDQTLESVPAYGRARQNFQSASRPLDTFDENRVPGQIVDRDPLTRRFTMPPERVPGAILNNGPSAVRDFNSVASPQAREALEQSIVTQVLDRASQQGADISAGSIRRALQQNEDILRQYPVVRDRLESIVIAREGLARIERSPIGKIANHDQTTKQAITALFPENPLPNSAGEISEAISAVAQHRPVIANQLVRTYAESVFNEASQRLASAGLNQSGGAKFAAVIRGNPQQAENLEAAVRALPNGNNIWPGFNAFMDNLEAQQYRQATGSRTAFKIPGVDDLKQGGVANNALQIVATGGFKWPQKALNAIQSWNVGRNLDDIAWMLTDPAAATAFRQIAAEPTGTSKALALTARLISIGTNSRQAERRPATRLYVTAQ